MHQLVEQVRERVLGTKSHAIVLVFHSFGYKHGVPKDADFVFDARFLPNPHWIPELKPLTGQDQPVQHYLQHQPMVIKYLWQLENFLSSWLPHLENSNRSYLTIAIGCTGGQHRSVFLAEKLAQTFAHRSGDVQVHHRTLDKRAQS